MRALAIGIALLVLLSSACYERKDSHRGFAASTGHRAPVRDAASIPRPVRPSPTSPPAPFPGGAAGFARDLTRIDRMLREDIPRWRAHGASLGSQLADRVSSEALRRQRIYRYLALKPVMARQVQRRVPRDLRKEMRANLRAARDLNSLVAPLKEVPKYRFARPLAPRKLRQLFLTAQRRYGVPWYVLAAINFVESKFGRVLGPSSSGAIGPMQFLPSTFAVYGKGDIKDPHDSIMAAANYLHASGAPDRLQSALFAYNHARAYVDAILEYAEQMRRNGWSFWAYYEYQVFVSTTQGSVRLTGPGTVHPDHTPGRPAPT